MRPVHVIRHAAIFISALAPMRDAAAIDVMVDSFADAPGIGSSACEAIVNGQTVCTLRAAMKYAGPMDRIVLTPGTYDLSIPMDASTPWGDSGSLSVTNRTINIEGVGGPAPVIQVSGALGGSAFRVEGSGALHATNIEFRGPGTSTLTNGGLVTCVGVEVTLQNALVSAFSSANGGALDFSNGCRGSITGTEFRDNHAGNRGGAVYISGGMSGAKVMSSTFIGNSAGDGGAIYCEAGGSGGELDARNSTFAYNSAIEDGGAAAIGSQQYCPVKLNNLTLIRNSGPYALVTTGDGMLSNSVVASNAVWGSDIRILSSTLTSGGNNRVGTLVYDHAVAVFHPNATDQLGIAEVDVRPLGYAPWNSPPVRTFLPASNSALENAHVDGVDQIPCEALDANGMSRTIGGACDIGAAENWWVADDDIIFQDDLEQ